MNIPQQFNKTLLLRIACTSFHSSKQKKRKACLTAMSAGVYEWSFQKNPHFSGLSAVSSARVPLRKVWTEGGNTIANINILSESLICWLQPNYPLLLPKPRVEAVRNEAFQNLRRQPFSTRRRPKYAPGGKQINLLSSGMLCWCWVPAPAAYCYPSKAFRFSGGIKMNNNRNSVPHPIENPENASFKILRIVVPPPLFAAFGLLKLECCSWLVFGNPSNLEKRKKKNSFNETFPLVN